jgi:glycerate dehydrogenase
MTRPKIVALDGATLNPGDNPWTAIERLGAFSVYDRTAPEQIIERSQGAAILVINKVKLPAKVLHALSHLKLVAVTATGFDCVDGAAARDSGIAVCNVPTYGTDSVAQHVLALMLHWCHRVDLHDAAVHNGDWCRSLDFCFWNTQLIELAGKTLGVIGFGRIGRRVGELANAFGMHLIAESRSRQNPPAWKNFQWATVDDVFASSDFLSLHCPLTDATRGIVNAGTLARMKPTAVLINTSRGGLIVEQELADSLNRGQIAGAALDVLSAEPPSPGNPLLTARNCIVTPHQAWATLEARKRLMHTTAENVAGFLAGRPQNVVNGA